MRLAYLLYFYLYSNMFDDAFFLALYHSSMPFSCTHSDISFSHHSQCAQVFKYWQIKICIQYALYRAAVD